MSYKLGLPFLSITVHLHIPNSKEYRYTPGSVEPGTALKADTGWIIHIHMAASAPSCYGESTSKALGCFLVLVAFSKNVAFTLHPCTHTGKKKNLKALHNYGYRNQF